jgi:hypothetical protein
VVVLVSVLVSVLVLVLVSVLVSVLVLVLVTVLVQEKINPGEVLFLPGGDHNNSPGNVWG